MFIVMTMPSEDCNIVIQIGMFLHRYMHYV